MLAVNPLPWQFIPIPRGSISLFSTNALPKPNSIRKNIPCQPFISLQFFTLPPLCIIIFWEGSEALLITVKSRMCTSPIFCTVSIRPISVNGPSAGCSGAIGVTIDVRFFPAPFIVIPLSIIICSA